MTKSPEELIYDNEGKLKKKITTFIQLFLRKKNCIQLKTISYRWAYVFSGAMEIPRWLHDIGKKVSNWCWHDSCEGKIIKKSSSNVKYKEYATF